MELASYKEKIESLVKDYLDANNLDLVELKVFFTSGRLNLRFLVDYKEGGITLDKCAQINQQIGEILDSSNLIDESYILDVSSPGLDRPLKSQADFKRSIGKILEVYFLHPVENKLQANGKLVAVDAEGIYLEQDNKKSKIKLEDISKAKVKIHD